MKFKKYIPPFFSAFLITLFYLPLCLNSQQIIWANKNNLDKRTDFTKVIGQNRFGLFVLKHKNSNFRKYFILEQFDRKMNLLKTKTFRIQNSELEKIVVHSEGILFFTREYVKGRFSKMKVQTIDSVLNESSPQTLFTGDIYADNISNIRVEYNNKRDLFLIWYLKGNDGPCDLNYILMNRKLVLRTGVIKLESDKKDIYSGDALIDNSGNFYLLYTHSLKFKSKTASDFSHRMLTILTSENTFKEHILNDELTFLSAYKLVYNPEFDYVSVFCLHGSSDEEENKSYSLLMINCRDHSIRLKNSLEFDRKTVAKVIGIKSEQKGENLSKFKIRKMIPKTDGGYLVICERIYITTQSDIFYVNGIPQSSYSRIFNNDEVMIINLDSNGVQLWTDIISKSQSSINDGGYYNGIVVMVNEDHFSILYNDRLNANADIIEITYAPDGTHTKKILLNSDEYYALLIPSEYGQVSSNGIVIPVNQNREFTYIKLLY